MSTAGATAPTSSRLVKLQRTAVRQTPTTAVAAASQAQPTAAEPVAGAATTAGAAQLSAAISSTDQVVLRTSGAAGSGSTQPSEQQTEACSAKAHRQQQADAVATAGVIPADTEAQSAATTQGESSSAAEKITEPDLTSPGSFSA